MAALTAALSTLARINDGDGKQTTLPTRQERIATFKNNVLTHAKKCGVLVMKNSTEQKKTLTLPSIRARPLDLEQQLEQQEVALEVLSLSDHPSGTSQDVDGISVTERITASRKERHEKTVEDMKQELTHVSNELELRMTKASEQLQEELSVNDKVLWSLFQEIDATEQLQSFSLDQLQNLWGKITDQTAIRIGCVKTLDAQLGSIEEDRIKLIEDILKSYAEMLGQIAYLLTEDVNRLISDEAQAVNLAVLSNKRKYSDLYLHLMIVEIEREKEYCTRWEDKVDEWKRLMQQMAEEQFQIYMKSDLVYNPIEVNKLKEFLVAEQKSINRKRTEQLYQLSMLKPPDTNKVMVEECHKTVTRLHNQLEELHNKFLVQLQNFQEVINMACLNEVEHHQEELVKMGACDVHEAYKLVGRSFLKLVEEHQSKTSSSLKTIEKQLDEVLLQQQEKFQQLYQLAHGAAHIWDTHCTTLTAVEQELTEALEECRSQHNTSNQQLETKLDVVLAMMREGSTDEALLHQMDEANNLLEQIVQGYVDFHTTMKEKSSLHPSNVQEELVNYDATLCQYFGVSRDPPVQKKPKRQIKGFADQKSRKATVATMRTDTRKTATIAPLESRLSKANTLAHIPAVELVETSNGTIYYICDPSILGDAPPQRSDDPSSCETQPDGVFLTQDEESELSTNSHPMTENLTITDEAFYDAKKRVRKEYLEQLESWKVSLVAKTKEELANKVEEYATEFDLRLHLHEPRKTRITQDIHNVRASELIAHRERLSHHIQGTNAELNKYKSNIGTLNNQLQSKHEELLSEMERAEDQLQVSTNLTELYKVEQDVKSIIDQHKAWLAHTTNSYQLYLETAANDLSSANSNFRSSLKLFSNGGNYCREEVEFFDRKLDRLTSKIKSAHATVVTEVGTALLTQQELVAKKLQEFVERFSVHKVDLKFLDKLSTQLTHTQVQIKAEVAASNSKSQELLQIMHTLKEDCNTCQHPTPDKPAVIPTYLMESLPVVFKACSARVEYLHCSVTTRKVPSKVGFLTEPATSSGTTTAPISAVNVTKSILEYVTAKRQFASEPNFDANRSLIVPRSPVLYNSQESARTPSVAPSSNEERRVSRAHGKKKKEEKMIDRKNVKYGSAGGDDKSDALLPRMRRILRESHLSLYKTCEQYYRAKGATPSTRPDEIPETFEVCMDSLIERLHSYQIQAEEYRRECIDEFNVQLKELMSVVIGLPMVVLSGIATHHTSLCRDDCKQLTASHRDHINTLLAQQKQHRALLRPVLGHPNNAKELTALREQEADRHQRTMDAINNHFLAAQAKEREHLECFVIELVNKTQSLLHALDDCVTVDDVISGGNKYGERPELEQLLRQHMNQETSSDPTTGGTKTKTSIDWPCLPTVDVLIKSLEMTCPNSKRSTSAHRAVITARDQLYQDHVRQHRERLQQLENAKVDEEVNEQKWLSSWNSSVEQVILLYK